MSNPRKTLGTALENRVVKRARAQGLKAHRQPLSGVLKEFPHDVVVEDLLIECKVRSPSISISGKKTLRFSLDYLRSVQADALKSGFAQGILIVNAKGDQRPLAVMDLDWFLTILSQNRHNAQ